MRPPEPPAEAPSEGQAEVVRAPTWRALNEAPLKRPSVPPDPRAAGLRHDEVPSRLDADGRPTEAVATSDVLAAQQWDERLWGRGSC